MRSIVTTQNVPSHIVAITISSLQGADLDKNGRTRKKTELRVREHAFQHSGVSFQPRQLVKVWGPVGIPVGNKNL